MDLLWTGQRIEHLAEASVSQEALLGNIARNPKAAGIALDLLHAIDLDGADGLVHESFAYAALQASGEHAAWLAGRASPALPAGKVQVIRQEDRLEITLDRPAAGNAIDRDMRDRLFEAFTVAALDQDIREVRLTATGKAFSVGADLSEFGTTRDPATAHAIRMKTLPALAIVNCASRMHAHVQGACIGAGVEMAAFATRLTATRNAWFQLPELAMGLIPGAGGCVSVPRRIGRRRAALLILSGRRIDAKTALAWGLIDAIVDEPPVDDRGADIAG